MNPCQLQTSADRSDLSISRLIFLSFILFWMLLSGTVHAQSSSGGQRSVQSKPSIVIGVVVDQMRYDYLYRYAANYSEKGFKRLVREGFNCRNANFDYVPTYTAPGHACIYTGTGPAVNGIISNEWYDRELRKGIYCVNDTTVSAVGTTSISGKMSPRRLLSTTMTDELRFATNYRSKVVSVALKDRGAILPAGFTGNYAFWHDPYLNNWVTSTYYMKELPSWAKKFNERKLVDSLLQRPWELLLPAAKYAGSTADDSPYEGLFQDEQKPVFPHNLPELKSANKELIRRTPMGNTYTLEFAKAAIEGEQLGLRGETDFLAVSFSSTDYVGHMFGINALETEDTYLRLDRELGEFIDYLDKKFGRSNYLLFLTADHGACPNPEFNADHEISSGRFLEGPMRDSLSAFLKRKFGSDDVLAGSDATGIYFDRELLSRKSYSAEEIQQACADYVLQFEGVAFTMTAAELSLARKREGHAALVQRGFHAQRSADVCIQLKPGWLDWMSPTGTSHGSAYSYDTHVPVLFFGGAIKPGETTIPVSVSDIAPTICSLLRISFPSGATGSPIVPLLDR